MADGENVCAEEHIIIPKNASEQIMFFIRFRYLSCESYTKNAVKTK
jgi:hypothetical protein